MFLEILHDWRVELLFLLSVGVPFILTRTFALKSDLTHLSQRLYALETQANLLDERQKTLPTHADITRLRVEIAHLSQLMSTIQGLDRRVALLENRMGGVS